MTRCVLSSRCASGPAEGAPAHPGATSRSGAPGASVSGCPLRRRASSAPPVSASSSGSSTVESPAYTLKKAGRGLYASTRQQGRDGHAGPLRLGDHPAFFTDKICPVRLRRQRVNLVERQHQRLRHQPVHAEPPVVRRCQPGRQRMGRQRVTSLKRFLYHALLPRSRIATVFPPPRSFACSLIKQTPEAPRAAVIRLPIAPRFPNGCGQHPSKVCLSAQPPADRSVQRLKPRRRRTAPANGWAARPLLPAPRRLGNARKQRLRLASPIRPPGGTAVSTGAAALCPCHSFLSPPIPLVRGLCRSLRSWW